ncbi:transposase [Nodosilinea nodulosa]|uniref:transposase n=1 Tax=Nodosilinea nodulosa TaxID=416001 RepID=UPI0002FFA96B|nr:transposase [Nodosilinea nodulosa]
MPYDPNKHHRRSIRLTGYDYASEGLYFITLCCHQRQHLFGTVVEGTMQLNALGQIVAEEWLKTPEIRPNFALGEWVVMPNHLHGVVIVRPSNKSNALAEGDIPVRAHRSAPQPPQPPQPLTEILYGDLPAEGDIPVRAHRSAPQPLQRRAQSISSFVAGFKAAATKRINLYRNAPGTPVWQRNYYEHIIRSEASLERIQHYIQNNPATWYQDSLSSANISSDETC